MAGPGFTPVSDGPPSTRGSGTGVAAARPRLRVRAPPQIPAAHQGPPRRTGTATDGAARPGRSGRRLIGPAEDLFSAAGGAGFAASGGLSGLRVFRGSDELTPGPAGETPGETLLVASPKFKLQYAVEDAGPSGPATVELWITHDGGRTWIRRGGDDDRVSPIEVDLGGEGTFGLCLVARSASGLGDQPPAPGDPPQSWVEVDSTAPVVQIQPPQIGTGVNAGKVAIAWKASDLHLPPRSRNAFLAPRSGRQRSGRRSPTAWITPASSSGTFRRPSPSGST